MTREQIFKELSRIQQSIPKALIENVVSETHLTPTIKDVIDKAIEDPDFPAQKKEQIIKLKEAGYFDKTVVRQNDKIAKMIDDFVARETRKAVRAGKLPTKKELLKIMKQDEK